MQKRWAKTIEPVVAKFDCARFDAVDCVKFNREGAAAMAALLNEMAERLDWVCDHPFRAFWQGIKLLR